jgi:hypothetical protein
MEPHVVRADEVAARDPFDESYCLQRTALAKQYLSPEKLPLQCAWPFLAWRPLWQRALGKEEEARPTPWPGRRKAVRSPFCFPHSEATVYEQCCG